MSVNIDRTGEDSTNKVTKQFSGSDQFSESLETASGLQTDGPGEDLSVVSGGQILLSLSQQTNDAGGDVGISCLLKVGNEEPPEIGFVKKLTKSLTNTVTQMLVSENSVEREASNTDAMKKSSDMSLTQMNTFVFTQHNNFDLRNIESEGSSSAAESSIGMLCCLCNCFDACCKSEEKSDLMVPVIPFVVSSSIRITPAKQLWVSKVNDSVKIRMAESGLGSEDPLTVHQMFKYSVEKYHNHIALAYKRDEHLYRISYSIYYEKCRMTAKGFLKLGLDRYHGVGIMAYNCPEWFFANIGAIMAGGLSVGIYMTSSPQTYQHLALNTKANILVVENRKLAEKVLKVKNELPHLKAIVQLKGRKKATDPKIYTWKQLMELSNDIADKQLDDIIDSQYANQCCLIAYTSGSTGAPKGVMISHDNITWNANTSGINMDFGHNNSQERLVSYMPLSHVAVQIMDLWIQMAFGGLTYFANLSTLMDEMREVEPTVFEGVPHIWEKMRRKVEHNQAHQSPLKVVIGLWARKVGRMASKNKINGKASVPLCYNVANALVFKKVHEEMGLDKCTRNFVGAAPISKRTLDFFHSLCIFIMPIYGLSESTGPHTTSISHQCQPLSCGKVMEGCKIKIYKTDEKLDGEICLWGRNIFMGYLNMPEQTEQTIDAEGWMHTGDLGYLSNDDFLFLTGKIKEFVILGNGMHINPLPIEDAIKNELTIVRHAVLIAIANDLIILLTLKCEVNENTGEPSDVLTRETIAYCRRIGSKATTVSNILFQKDPAIYNAITKGIENVNKKTNSNIPKMNTFIILKRDFSIYGGELGPTLKVRRHVVEQLYKEQMD